MKRARGPVVLVGGIAGVLVMAATGAVSWARTAGLVAAAVALVAFVLIIRGLGHAGVDAATRFDAVTRARPDRSPHRPVGLDRMEGLAMLHRTAFDVHFRLRPVLREIAQTRLWVRRRIDLDRDPVAAEAALGSQLYDIVRADRETPRDRMGSGLESVDELAGFVTTLEAL